MPRPPLKAVAELAAVSEPTVSRVINGRSGVADATRSRVLAVLAELGYEGPPEPTDTRRGVVGLISGEFSNPVFPTFVDHIAADLSRQGLLTTIALTDPNQNPEERCIDELMSSGVDGIVLLGGRHAEVDGALDVYRRLIDSRTPVVLVNGRRTDLSAPHVICDEQVGARRAVQHMLSLGHSRIGCILGAPKYVPTARMISGWRTEMLGAGLEAPDEAIIHTTFTLEGGRAATDRFLDLGYTALLTGNDLMALGAISAANNRGVSVPFDLSVVGYDGTALTALTAPPLTTLRQPFPTMARLIADALASELAGSDRLRDTFVFEPELVTRGSSARPAGSTPGLTA